MPEHHSSFDEPENQNSTANQTGKRAGDMSVIVCCYTESRWQELVAAVDSLKQQNLLPAQIIVVVDHNRALAERVQREIHGVVILENRYEHGLSGARNTGIASVHGEVIAFMDEDATAAPDWLALLWEGYQSDDVFGVGGSIVPAWVESRPVWFPEEFDWVVGCTYRGMPSTPTPVRNLIGCNMSFRREIFEAVGGFRIGIGRIGTRPLGCEETELCIRLKQRWPNASLLFNPAAQVSHRVPPQRAAWRYFRWRCYSEGLSKAQIAQFVGAGDALASERTYALQTLTRAIVRSAKEGVVNRDGGAFLRAGAILAGLLLTGVGYIYGTLYDRFPASKKSRSAFQRN